MNENQPNFEELTRLLKLKRHEVPPPRFFNNFSDHVIDRIRAGEAGGAQGLVESLQVNAPWLLNFFRTFETRPGMIGSFAVSLCLLLVLGVVFAEYSEKQSIQPTLAVTGVAPATPATDNLAALSAPNTAGQVSSGGIVASTNPVTSLAPVATLFGQTAASPLFQPAGFAPGH